MIPESIRKQLGPMVHAEEDSPPDSEVALALLFARNEAPSDKIPVGVQPWSFGPGYIMCIHMDDLPKFIRAYLGVHSPAKRLVKVRSREDGEGRLPQLSHGTPDSFDF